MPLYRFVDAPTSSPTVLLDLDDRSPLTVVEGVSTSPPNRRVSSFGSAARNGDVLAQKSYPDRQITIPLEFALNSTAEQHSETIQKLARLLDGEAWLQWQHDGKIEPVFYRTKYGDMDIQDSIADETPLRYVTVSITAEYAAYGLPVTGSATIANDPTAATNPMSYVFPDIQGDVATPLWFEWVYSTGVGNHRTCAVVACSAGDATPDTPSYLILNTASADMPTGWSYADEADASFLNGTRRRVTKTSGTASATVASVVTMPFVPGDYRILVRTTADQGTTLSLDATTGSGPFLTYTVPSTAVGEMTWFDIGVARFPIGQPLLDSATSLVPTLESSFSFLVGLPTSTGVVDFDALLFVPVGLDEAVATSYASCALPYSSSGYDYFGTLDGINRQAYSKVDFGLGDRLAGMVLVAGGLPALTPGVKNVLTLVPYAFAGASGSNQWDDKTFDTAITYRYFPRYLYDRPATS